MGGRKGKRRADERNGLMEADRSDWSESARSGSVESWERVRARRGSRVRVSQSLPCSTEMHALEQMAHTRQPREIRGNWRIALLAWEVRRVDRLSKICRIAPTAPSHAAAIPSGPGMQQRERCIRIGRRRCVDRRVE